ncbi:hypothetical protein C8J57DRAFT_1228679 [Mycena rebaudengoi]|nr:hypothetical protein C8J57DRAFT_1228679 [Mycena rebaudengoi]
MSLYVSSIEMIWMLQIVARKRKDNFGRYVSWRRMKTQIGRGEADEDPSKLSWPAGSGNADRHDAAPDRCSAENAKNGLASDVSLLLPIGIMHRQSHSCPDGLQGI